MTHLSPAQAWFITQLYDIMPAAFETSATGAIAKVTPPAAHTSTHEGGTTPKATLNALDALAATAVAVDQRCADLDYAPPSQKTAKRQQLIAAAADPPRSGGSTATSSPGSSVCIPEFAGGAGSLSPISSSSFSSAIHHPFHTSFSNALYHHDNDRPLDLSASSARRAKLDGSLSPLPSARSTTSEDDDQDGAWTPPDSPDEETTTGAHRCPECGKRYSTSSNLARHRQIHRSVTDKKARTCPQCGKVYVSMPAYSMHVRTHKNGCECPFCGKRFSRPWLLQGHIRTHTGEKPFACDRCHKAFADKSNLRAHIQTHSMDKPFVCGRCGKAFALKSYLYKHEESSCYRGARGSSKKDDA